MGLLTLTQIPCHHVLANEIALNLKYRIGLKHFFNINLGIGIIKKTTFFVYIFDISPHVFTQISIRRSRWMQNLIPQPTSSPDRNLSKSTGRYEKTKKKVVFFMIPIPKFILKKCLRPRRYFKFKAISLANT